MVYCNLNLILAKLNFEIRTVVFCTQEFQTWKALNLTNPTKIQAIIPKQKKTKKRKTKYVLYIHYLQCKNALAIAEGHDCVTSKSDEGFTLPDSILTRPWSLLQNQAKIENIMNSAITITLYTMYSSRIYNVKECRKNGWRFMQNKKFKNKIKKRIAMT